MKANELLEKELKNGGQFHAYLIIGSDENEIEKMAQRIVAKKECLPEDLAVLRAGEDSGKSGEIKAEDAREFLRKVSLTPIGKSRVAIIYGSERLNNASANVMLRSIEEPSSFLTYIFLAKNDNVISTIKSRCRIYKLSSVPKECEEKYFETFSELNFFEASAMADRIIKEGKIVDFIEDSLASLRQRLLMEEETVVDKIEFLIKIKKNIKNNANQRLALETFWVKIKENDK